MGLNLPFAPLDEMGPEDNQALQQFIDKVSDVNVVNDLLPGGGTVKDHVEHHVWHVIRRAKQRRLPLEQEWLAIQRMIVLQADNNRKYNGHSKAYIPVYKRNRKTLVSNLSKGLFPSDDVMDVTDREQGMNEQAKACKEVIRFEWEQAGLRRTIKSFLGQYVDFGVSCLKAMFRSDRIMKAKTPTPDNPMGLEQDIREGMDIKTRSMFNVVVYPEWAESKSELLVEAERMEVSIEYVKAMRDSKRWLNVDDALLNANHNDEFDWVNTSTLADVAQIPSTIELRGLDGSPAQTVIIVEAWCRVPMPASQYAPFENKNLSLPARVVFVNGVAVQVRRNPLWHQESPFLYARDNQIIGSFYADGSGNATKDLQQLANDHFNQMNDAMTFGMNPVGIVNTTYFAGAPSGLKPGAMLKTRDIDKAIKFQTPPVAEIVQYGHQHTMAVVTMAQDAGGAPPVMQGARGGSTATSTQILQNNAQGPVQDQVEDIEADVMVPLMRMTWQLSRQYRTQAFIREFAAGDLVKFLPAEVDNEFDFRYLASTQAINRQVRQQGLTMFTDLATRLAPMLQQQGLTLNAREILQRAWNDGLGNRNFDKVVVPLMMPPMPGQPPMPGMSLPQGGAPSAVPQGNVPGAEMNEPAMGEGTELPEVMSGVQEINAMNGQFNGPPEEG